jgi:hypothetical protein
VWLDGSLKLKTNMPGLKAGELMHEWMKDDSPQFDIDPEQVTLQLAHDNDIMLQLIKELGGEDELRKRIAAV